MHLKPKELIPIVATELRKMGFHIVRRGQSGSRYLRLAEYHYSVRVSDHTLPPRRVAENEYRNVLDIVLEPTEIRDIPALTADIARRYIRACESRISKPNFKHPTKPPSPPKTKHPKR